MLSTGNQSQASQRIQKIARDSSALGGDVLKIFVVRTQRFVDSLGVFEEVAQGAAHAEKTFGDYCFVTILRKTPIETFTKLFAFRNYCKAVFNRLPDVGSMQPWR